MNAAYPNVDVDDIVELFGLEIDQISLLENAGRVYDDAERNRARLSDVLEKGSY